MDTSFEKPLIQFFAAAYLIDLLITVRQWIAMGEPSIGLMYFSFLGFLLYYYLILGKIVLLAIGSYFKNEKNLEAQIEAASSAAHRVE